RRAVNRGLLKEGQLGDINNALDTSGTPDNGEDRPGNDAAGTQEGN
ncbi:hypothetical protein AHiyo1_52590, partial [Arthrobacter sp. Hiyo1]